MIKTPTTNPPVPPAFLEERTQFLHDYGAFLAHWAEFELAVEVKIAKLTNLKPLDASIVLGSLNFGSKSNILCSLLNEREEVALRSKIRSVTGHAKRNKLVHGAIASDLDDPRFAFIKREVGNEYVVDPHHFTAASFNKFFERFRELTSEALTAMGVAMQDIEDYGREARFFESDPQRPPSRRPDAAIGSK